MILKGRKKKKIEIEEVEAPKVEEPEQDLEMEKDSQSTEDSTDELEGVAAAVAAVEESGSLEEDDSDSDEKKLPRKVRKELKRLRHELEEAQTEIHQGKERHLRALADLENFKKRAIEERAAIVKYQGEHIFSDLLDVADNFDRAIENLDTDPEQLKVGVQMIHKSLVDVLNKYQVTAEPAVGSVFDPNKHAALSQIPTADAEAGTVISELKKAYFYKDKLLRAAEVVVATAPPSEDSENSEPADAGAQEHGLDEENHEVETDPSIESEEV